MFAIISIAVKVSNINITKRQIMLRQRHYRSENENGMTNDVV